MNASTLHNTENLAIWPLRLDQGSMDLWMFQARTRARSNPASRKPDETYDIIEACSSGPFLEMFARGTRKGWTAWGNQAEEYEPTWKTYANHSASERKTAGRKKAGAPTLFD